MDDFIFSILAAELRDQLLFVFFGVVVLFIPLMLGVNFLNGLLFLQIPLIINSGVVFFGVNVGVFESRYAFQIVFLELFFYLIIIFFYGSLLKKARKDLIFDKCFGSKFRFFIVLLGLVYFFSEYYGYSVRSASDSRIIVKTSSVYSFVKPIITIGLPLCYFYVVVAIIKRATRYEHFFVLVLIVAGNILSGSKASFLISLLSTFLIVRDVLNDKLRFFSIRLIGMCTAFGLLGYFALLRIGVRFEDLVIRFVKYAESSILVLLYPDAVSTCSELGILARVHRGLARFLGDSKALDPDTLFGFGLSMIETGVNTFTGPNARFGSYVVCNFKGSDLMLAFLVPLVWILLTTLSVRFARRRECQVLMPFFLYALIDSIQDYYLVAHYFTLMILIFSYIVVVSVLPKRRVLRDTVG